MHASYTRANRAFFLALVGTAGVYPAIIAALVFATVGYSGLRQLWAPWDDPALRYAAGLSLGSSLTSGALALLMATPCGYVLSRFPARGTRLLDVLVYLPIVLPGLVIGVALLIFFQTSPGRFIEQYLMTFTFAVKGVILAQTVVATASATRIMKMAFDAVPVRRAQVARTLGATRWQAFWHVELAEARSGLFEAYVLAWATAFGSFGPVVLFCGTTRFRTEVLSASVFLEFSIGNLERALAVSLWMGMLTGAVLLIARGLRRKRALW